MPHKKTEAAENSTAVLRSGYSVAIQQQPGGDTLAVHAPDGELCVSISLTPEGPHVELRACSLNIAAEGDLRLGANRLTIEAASDLTVRAGGDLHQEAGGDVRVAAQGSFRSAAFDQRHEATTGNLELEANDDVSLEGERVRLNSPETSRMVPGFVRPGGDDSGEPGEA